MARRNDKPRQIRSREVVIIGEGKTERFYFTHLKRLKGFRYSCRPRYFTQQSLSEIDNQVKKVLDDGGIAVCVFDADVARMYETDKAKLAEIKAKYVNRNDVIICDSMPSIEFWFLLHFINTNRFFATSDDAEAQLRKYLIGYEKTESYLQKEKWVQDLIASNRMDLALTRAKLMAEGGQSYSNLYKAFESFSES